VWDAQYQKGIYHDDDEYHSKQSIEVMRQMRLLFSAVLLSLFVVCAYSQDSYYRDADGLWHDLETTVEAGRITVRLTSAMAAAEKCLIVVEKPQWMTLDDHMPPEITSIVVDGHTIDGHSDGISLGVLDGDSIRIAIGLHDQSNPISADAQLQYDGSTSMRVDLDTSGLGPSDTAGNLIINLSDLDVGDHQSVLRVRDLSPQGNCATWPVSFTVTGISVADDRQSVMLANSVGAFGFAPGLDRQIKLPVGQQLYLTSSLGGWIYPRQLDEVQITEDSPARKTVLIRSSTLENEKREPVTAPARIEYELTILPDSPCLLVDSRLYNTGDAAAKGSFFWGWLGADHFVTPTHGEKKWEGVAQNAYIDVGHVDWVWLAPKDDSQLGLVWISDAKFMESRFDTMLLRAPEKVLQVGEHMEMRFAIASASSPEEAEMIFVQVAARGLLPALGVD
jgi:hypothetical protein